MLHIDTNHFPILAGSLTSISPPKDRDNTDSAKVTIMSSGVPGDTPANGRTFAVVGATGQQGGATARALLKAGVSVRALARTPDGPAASELAALGAKVVRADLEDPDSLRNAFTGVDGVFAMTTPAPPGGVEGEVAHGKLIVDAARDAVVPRLVYSSVGGADRHTGIPHFESKRRVERYLAESGVAFTLVRPTFFMDNFRGAGPTLEDGVLVLRSPLAAGVPLQMIAAEDVGHAAAAALLDPDDVPGGAIEIAGDELTGEQIAAVYGARAGRPARFESLGLEVLAGDEDMHKMFAWFDSPPAYRADLAATRTLVPAVKTFPAWLAAEQA